MLYFGEMKHLLLLIFSFPISVFAFNSSESLIEFCHNRLEPKYVKNLTIDSSNLMSFKNRGGLGGGGVCWWHSRFQRNALYLTYFSPDKEKLPAHEIPWLLRRIRNANDVLEIPGFENFQEFSSYYKNEIQEELETWQRFEGLRFTWIRGLRGSSRVSADWLRKLMDNLFEEVEEKNNIGYQKLQMKGLKAHAWLVINMVKLENGYDLEVLDSNLPDMTTMYQYRYGDTHLVYADGSQFTPYMEYVNEMERINSAISRACNTAGEN